MAAYKLIQGFSPGFKLCYKVYIQFKGFIMLMLILSINTNGEDCTL